MMKDDYWTLFCITGEPVFYLLYRREIVGYDESKTAWCAPDTELV